MLQGSDGSRSGRNVREMKERWRTPGFWWGRYFLQFLDRIGKKWDSNMKTDPLCLATHFGRSLQAVVLFTDCTYIEVKENLKSNKNVNGIVKGVFFDILWTMGHAVWTWRPFLKSYIFLITHICNSRPTKDYTIAEIQYFFDKYFSLCWPVWRLLLKSPYSLWGQWFFSPKHVLFILVCCDLCWEHEIQTDKLESNLTVMMLQEKEKKKPKPFQSLSALVTVTHVNVNFSSLCFFW